MEKTIIIVAGGQGMRFKAEKPKQFLYIRDRPITMHTIELFHYYDRKMQIILGIAENNFSYWDSVCEQFHFDVPLTLSPGGETRYHTVKNALSKVEKGNLVGIHDAVRPLVYKHTIDRCYEESEKYILFRQKKAGAKKNVFSKQAIDLVYNHSNGTPRLINHLCDLALLIGRNEKKSMISSGIIKEILNDETVF